MVIGKNVESTFFPFFVIREKNVEVEKILKFDIFGVKFKKGKNVELYILKGKKCRTQILKKKKCRTQNLKGKNVECSSCRATL